jgi:uncharacterized GH25 family protein
VKRTLSVVVMLGTPALTAAHDFWVERSQEAFVVRYEHRGELLPIDAAKLKAIRCGAGAGAPGDVTRGATFSEKEVRFAGPCEIVSVFSDGGYWTLTPDGEVNRPKDEVRNGVRSWASRQYAKWVDAKSPRAATVLGDELELVPVTDLARARAGDKVTLRLLSARQPVRNAVVSVQHRAIGETDSKGEIRLRLRTAGTESISASIRRPHPTSQADVEVLEASLTFEVAR